MINDPQSTSGFPIGKTPGLSPKLEITSATRALCRKNLKRKIFLLIIFMLVIILALPVVIYKFQKHQKIQSDSDKETVVAEMSPTLVLTESPTQSVGASQHVTSPAARPSTIVSNNGGSTKERPIEIIVDDGTLFSPVDDGYSYPYYNKILKKFYEKHPDIYDFVNIFDDQTPLSQARHHTNVKFIEYGIGTGGIFDESDYYGSKGRLLGINTMNSIDEVADSREAWIHNALIHETAHQWLLYLRDSSLEKLHNPVSFPHWTPYLDLGGNDPMGGGYTWIDNKNGTCTAVASELNRSEVFSWLSLYLMGLAKPEEVPKTFFADHQDGAVSDDFKGFDFEIATNRTVACASRFIEIADFISAFGPRRPDYNASQKDFNVAYILVLRRQSSVSAEQKLKLRAIAELFPQHWARATRGRSKINPDNRIVFDYAIE